MLLTDGFPTLVDIDAAVLAIMHEKGITPPTIEGGGENDTTTMRNTVWRTRFPKLLKTLGEMSFTCAYDPAVYEDLVDIINVNKEITVTFPDGTVLTFWGWLDNFAPGEIVEGEQPEATATVIASNMDDNLDEVGPTITPGT